LSEEWRAIPTLRMIFQSPDEIRLRAERLTARLYPLDVSVKPGESAIGGGSTPDQILPTWLVTVTVADPDHFECKLRRAPVPVIARIEREQVVLDLRTVAPKEEEDLVAAIQTAALHS
jgi:L-seryl-tRNA(Ser) seleniumtransferase